MRIFSRYSLIAIIATGLSLTSCNKDNSVKVTDEAILQQQMAADETNVNIEAESSMNDVNDAMAISGIGKTSILINATIDSSSILFKKITIRYNGKSADSSRIRNGSITVQLTNGNSWKDQLATINIIYKNYRVTRVATGKNLSFDGTITATNMTGGTAFIDPAVVHKIEASEFSITFRDDSSSSAQVDWNLACKRTFTNISGVLAVSIEGTGIAGVNSNLLAWGKNRNSDNFYTQIFTPVVYNTIWSNKCPGLFISGEKIFKGLLKEITLTLGLDQSGNTVPANSSNCPGYYKIEWPNSTGKPLILSY